jgi:hypothetical protein
VLDEVQVPYMLVGSFSSNLYGRERGTKDADFVVTIESSQQYIRNWCDQHGTRELFEQLQQEAVRLNTPPIP